MTQQSPETAQTEARTDSESDVTSEKLEGRGLRMLVLGALLALLAPLAGFLGGSIVESSADDRVDPLALWLFGGLVVGGIGAVIAFIGGLRWVQANRGRL